MPSSRRSSRRAACSRSATRTIRGATLPVFVNAPANMRDYFALFFGASAAREFVVYRDERQTFAAVHAHAVRIAAAPPARPWHRQGRPRRDRDAQLSGMDRVLRRRPPPRRDRGADERVVAGRRACLRTRRFRHPAGHRRRGARAPHRAAGGGQSDARRGAHQPRRRRRARHQAARRQPRRVARPRPGSCPLSRPKTTRRSCTRAARPVPRKARSARTGGWSAAR